MSLIGYRDLYFREVNEFLNETLTFSVEKKIEEEFAAQNFENPPATVSTAALFAESAISHFPNSLKGKYARAFELSILVHILQNRSKFLFATFVSAVNAANQEREELIAHPGFTATQAETEFLQASLPQLKETALLILTAYFSNIYQHLSKVETCTFLEQSKLGIEFLKEIEKGCLEDRWLAKLLGLYHNYFKNFAPDKGEPALDVYREIQLVVQLEREAAALEKVFLSNISFEKKEHLQKKGVRENAQLLAFISAYQSQLETLSSTVTKLQGIKQQRLNIEVKGFMALPEGTSNLEATSIALGKAILTDIKRIHDRLRIQSESDSKQAAENKKFKRKVSPSWLALEALCSSKGGMGGEMPKLREADELTENFPFEELGGALTGILAPAIEVGKKPKMPKGTRDTTPLQMIIKSRAIEKIRSVYYKHGAVEIDTPIFELKETLLGKYGEEGGKLIYDLEDQGGELLSLRYDLTVPFARFMGYHNVQKIKRFHIGKVYRRDQPNINKGRFREFYQCDFDIAGKTDPMIAEAEILKIAVEILTGFDLKFKLKVSHRSLLEAMIEVAGCEPQKFKAICSSIDKLDKEPWSAVERELIGEKGLNSEQTKALKEIVLHKGSFQDVIQLIEEKKIFKDNEKAKKSVEELKILKNFIQLFKIDEYVEFDLSLARGLDYYTGVIYEGVLTDGETSLGSIAGGGRYDELIGMFSKDKIPAIGISIGIERLFMLLEAKYEKESRPSETEFLIATIGKKGTLEKKLELAARLWAGNVKAEITYDAAPKPDRQLKYALEHKIPFVLWVGEDEVTKKAYKIKILYKKEEISVTEDNLVEEARKLSVVYADDLLKGAVVFKE